MDVDVFDINLPLRTIEIFILNLAGTDSGAALSSSVSDNPRLCKIMIKNIYIHHTGFREHSQ